MALDTLKYHMNVLRVNIICENVALLEVLDCPLNDGILEKKEIFCRRSCYVNILHALST
jgi:hypothetical protein